MKKVLLFLTLFPLLFLTPSLWAQDTEIQLRPSNNIRVPDLENGDQSSPVLASQTNENTAILPTGETWSTGLSAGWWYISLGIYNSETIARNTGNNLLTAMGNQGGRRPALAYSGSILYLGPLKPGEIFTFVNLVKSLGWKTVELYRP